MKSLLYLLIIFSLSLFADTLTIAVSDFPPCVIFNENEKPTGFDIDVFDAISREAGLNINYVSLNEFPALLDGVEKRIYDGALAGITITGDRESCMDFTHPYLNSGLAICISKDARTNPFGTIFRYIHNMGPMLMVLLIFSFVCGILIFIIEKIFSKENSMFNPDDPVRGIANGFYFSNVFSSTVGFGDLIPKSIPGRLLTVVMIIVGVYFIFPYAIANMSVALQEENASYAINSVDDLPGKTVATEDSTTSLTFLKKIGCNVKAVKNINEAYALLGDKKIEAVVFDMPTIKYFIKNKGNNKFKISGNMFDRQSYGFALQKDSPYRKILNEKLVDFMRTDEYWELQQKWFGE